MALICTITSYPNNEVRARLSPPHATRRPTIEESLSEQHEETLPVDVVAQKPDSPILDISAENATRNDSDLKPGYGLPCKPTRFGTFARRKLQRIGGVLDKLVESPLEGIFFTGTIPGSTLESFNAVADWSAWIVHSFKAWCFKYVRSPKFFYVWEKQKRGALHLHYYLHVPCPIIRQRLIDGFQAEWCRLLDGVSKRSGIDVYDRGDGTTHADDKSVIQAYAQPVRKSVAAYLSKYCSKQSSEYSSSDSRLRCPSRWWGCSRELTKQLDLLTVRLEITYSSVSRARSQYEEITATLERHAIKGYRYGDKVGYGLNHVFYYEPTDTQLVTGEVMSKFKPLSMLDLTGDSQAFAELRAVLSVLPTDAKFNTYVSANLSVLSSKAAANAVAGFGISHYEAYAISTEIESFCKMYTLSRGYTTVLQKRILSSCTKIASHFKNLVLVETP